MKKNVLVVFSLIFLSITLLGCTSPEKAKPVELSISAAASMNDALQEIQTTFEEKQQGKIKLLFNFASSGTLQRQIEQGAPVDLFLSASKGKMEALVQQHLISDNVQLLKNKIILVTKKGAAIDVKGFSDLEKEAIKKIAVGIPESVPAGRYAKETLVSLELWEKLQPKLVFTKDVRQVLNYVETGNADAGLVYSTDAMISPKVTVVTEASETLHSPIIYPVGIVKNTKHLDEAQVFYQFLQTDEAKVIFEKYGFNVF